MPWSTLLLVIGSLCLFFAGVEWGLLRLEQNAESKPRVLRFGSIGCSLLLLYGGAVVLPSQFVAGTHALSPPSIETRLVQEFSQELSLIQAVRMQTARPTLHQVRQDRAGLLEARRRLAKRPVADSETESVLGQVDTLLGVAYQVLGDQWRLVRQGDWSETTRQESLRLLTTEWARWEEMRQCLIDQAQSCRPRSQSSERHEAIQRWQRELRIYLLECLRFDEEDPDLAWLPPVELRTTQQRLADGRSFLRDHPLPDWGAPITEAADQLFIAADQAIQREQIAAAQGRWTRQMMERTYQPVRTAWEILFRRAFCALDGPAPCLDRSQ
jgi:hypothetical protein